MRNRFGESPRVILILLLCLISVPSFAQKQLLLPGKQGSLRFAVIGDTGTGGKPQYEVASQLAEWRARFPFEFVLMMGDNLYGGENPKDYRSKFEVPYKPLLDAGVKFYASLGNHDDANQRFYKNFNMGGKRYYTFRPKPGIRFFALDSNYMDREQLGWLQTELRSSGSEWKICFFHHPLYSSGGRHGSDVELREVLEPVFVQFGVSAVFTGHEHFYERLKPQQGIYYFISGAGGQLRRGDIRKTNLTAKGFDQDNHFVLVEIAGDEMYFQAISRTGATVDSGVIARPQGNSKATAGTVMKDDARK
jgi:3',5'-cyclic AMP phosphodiesterase CpdA